ncbi:hypothetical protein RRG08_025232 [Elysia crispata]|uniref:Uncharacterized protein n=1 Tax=Elysia crispata TaxID=231223 RepID=A0AAE1AAK4_9GAST|nr:hypothetical protein RRG08_025232 [Elysia crispata]
MFLWYLFIPCTNAENHYLEDVDTAAWDAGHVDLVARICNTLSLQYGTQITLTLQSVIYVDFCSPGYKQREHISL